MLATEIANLAKALEEAQRVPSLPALDLGQFAARLRAIAEGVGHLEAITVPSSARVIPVQFPRDRAGNIVAFPAGGRP